MRSETVTFFLPGGERRTFQVANILHVEGAGAKKSRLKLRADGDKGAVYVDVQCECGLAKSFIRYAQP